LVDQDLRIINLAKLEGKPIIIVVNKIDLVKKSEEKKFFDDIKFRNPIFQNLNMVKISAKNNVGIDYLVKKAVTTFELASKKFTTRRLNNLIDKALDAVNVPSYGGREIKIKYVNFGGNFPTWLAPVQVVVLPLSNKFTDYAKIVVKSLKNDGIRVKLNDKADKIGFKIRQAELEKINFMLIVGAEETNDGTVSVRKRFVGDLGVEKLDKFKQKLIDEIKNRRLAHRKETATEAE